MGQLNRNGTLKHIQAIWQWTNVNQFVLHFECISLIHMMPFFPYYSLTCIIFYLRCVTLHDRDGIYEIPIECLKITKCKHFHGSRQAIYIF